MLRFALMPELRLQRGYPERKIVRVMTASIARSAGLTAVKILLIAILIRDINCL